VAADFTDVDVAIARTQPRYDGNDGAHEVEALFLDSIDQAERSIYVENQFLTCPEIAARLACRLRQRPALEVVIVAPRSHDSWLERRTMRNGRIRFWRTLSEAGGPRVRLLYPSVEQAGRATDTMIHSKVMVVDDRLLRVGSANINNRSMGADTECDLAIEAASDAERAAIARVRNRLLGEHCGVTAEEVAAELARHGSLVQAAQGLAAGGHSLRPIDDGEPDDGGLVGLAEQVADPTRPLRLARLLGGVFPRSPLATRAIVLILVLCLAALGLTLAWHFTGLSQIVAPDRVRELLSAARGEPWAVVLVVVVFVLAGAVAFPVNVLIFATAAVFGPWFGALYAALGALSSALVMYGVGARFGREALARLAGRRLRRALEAVRTRGVPVNLAAGASAIRLTDFVLGTLLGMAPGVALMAVMGDRVASLFAHPTAGELGLLALCAVAWIALAFSAQALLSRRGGRAS
jgi:uncharacterized membrane protein YdjX (TVP38/TMEM64 family)